MSYFAPPLLAGLLFGAASLAASPVASAAPLQGYCDFANEIHVLGTIASVSQAPAGPLAGVAIGDAFDMSLRLGGGDVLCGPAFGNSGQLSNHRCARMTVGGVTVLGEPMLADSCIWGEQRSPASPFYAEAVVADAPFGTSDVRAVLELDDPDGLVGISLYALVGQTIFVPSVTAPGFAARLTLQDAAGTELAVIDITEISGTSGLLSNTYCDSTLNSAGTQAGIAYRGSLVVADNDAGLVGYWVPTNTLVLFLVSDTQGFFANPGGSAGNLCLRGDLQRFAGPGQIQSSNASGFASIDINLNAMPSTAGTVQTLPGMTWNFSAWFRDATPAGATTSNFTDGMSMTFQ